MVVIAEIEVERKSGRIWARKFTVAHDCGLIINPPGLRYTTEGGWMQAPPPPLVGEAPFDPDQARGVALLQKAALLLPDALDTRLHLAVGLIKGGDTPAARKDREQVIVRSKQEAQTASAGGVPTPQSRGRRSGRGAREAGARPRTLLMMSRPIPRPIPAPRD